MGFQLLFFIPICILFRTVFLQSDQADMIWLSPPILKLIPSNDLFHPQVRCRQKSKYLWLFRLILDVPIQLTLFLYLAYYR